MNGDTPGNSRISAEHPDRPRVATTGTRTSNALPSRLPRWWCHHPRPRYARPTGVRRVYVPIYGWLDIDDDHRARVERFFHLPMLILALLVLPLLLVEWSYGDQFHTAHPLVQTSIYAGGAVIWLAFLIEFVVKVWIAQSRWSYITRNWLDIVIVALPMLRPLRGFRLVRAVQVARMSRVFTLRGVVMKLLRTAAATVLGLEFVRRLRDRFRGPPCDEVPLPYEQWSRACLIAEIRKLNERIRELERQSNSAEEQEAEGGKTIARPPDS